MNENNTTNDSMSLSKQRKIQRKKDIARTARNKKIGRVVWLVVLALLAAFACFCVFLIVRRSLTRVPVNENTKVELSKGLTENGFYEGVKAADIVELTDYKGIKVPYSNIEFTDEDLQKHIDSLCSEKAEQSTTTDKEVAKDDVIVVDYKVYYEDGTEVPNSATGESGLTVTVGSSTLKDYGFDDALVGKKVSSEAFDVEVTFPEDYSGTLDVKGKKVKYTVTVRSIKITPEFNDEFVTKYLKDKAETVEAYKTYYRDKMEHASLLEYMEKVLVENSTAKSYPKDCLKQQKLILKYNSYQTYLYYNSYWYTYFGQIAYANYEAYLASTVGMTEEKFDRTTLVESAKEQLAEKLFFQAVAEKENITSNVDEYKEYILGETDADKKEETEKDFDSAVESSGKGYLAQQYLRVKVSEFMAANATVVKD